MRKYILVGIIVLAMVLSVVSIYNQTKGLNTRVVGIWRPESTNNPVIEPDHLSDIDIKPGGTMKIGEVDGTWKHKKDRITLYDRDGGLLGQATVLKESDKWVLVVTLELDQGDGTQYIYGR